MNEEEVQREYDERQYEKRREDERQWEMAMEAEMESARPPVHPGVVLLHELQAKGMSQREFARRMDVSKDVVYRWIHRQQRIWYADSIKISYVLHIPPEMWDSLQLRWETWRVQQGLRGKK